MDSSQAGAGARYPQDALLTGQPLQPSLQEGGKVENPVTSGARIVVGQGQGPLSRIPNTPILTRTPKNTGDFA